MKANHFAEVTSAAAALILAVDILRESQLPPWLPYRTHRHRSNCASSPETTNWCFLVSAHSVNAPKLKRFSDRYPITILILMIIKKAAMIQSFPFFVFFFFCSFAVRVQSSLSRLVRYLGHAFRWAPIGRIIFQPQGEWRVYWAVWCLSATVDIGSRLFKTLRSTNKAWQDHFTIYYALTVVNELIFVKTNEKNHFWKILDKWFWHTISSCYTGVNYWKSVYYFRMQMTQFVGRLTNESMMVKAFVVRVSMSTVMVCVALDSHAAAGSVWYQTA